MLCCSCEFTSFGAEGKVKLGGIISYIADIEVSGKVGIYNEPYKKEGEINENKKIDDSNGLNAVWGYL